jgi:serine/threonine protein kinase
MEYVDGMDLQELIDRLAKKMFECAQVMTDKFTFGNLNNWPFQFLTEPLGEWSALASRFRPSTPLAAIGERDKFYAGAMQIIIHVSQTLRYLHIQNIFHRDVKPKNIMLSRDGRVLLMDFGIVSLPDTSRLTGPADLLYTPGYEAPEIREGHAADAQTDIFSLGVSLYELLCLHRFSPSKPYRKCLFSSLVNIINKATAFLRKERYRSIDTLRDDLEDCLNTKTKGVIKAIQYGVTKYAKGFVFSYREAQLLKSLTAKSQDAVLRDELAAMDQTALILYIDQLPIEKMGKYPSILVEIYMALRKDHPVTLEAFLERLPETMKDLPVLAERVLSR